MGWQYTVRPRPIVGTRESLLGGTSPELRLGLYPQRFRAQAGRIVFWEGVTQLASWRLLLVAETQPHLWFTGVVEPEVEASGNGL